MERQRAPGAEQRENNWGKKRRGRRWEGGVYMKTRDDGGKGLLCEDGGNEEGEAEERMFPFCFTADGE